MIDASSVLVVFARYPQLGSVKTRLSPLLGDQACLKLHQSLLSDTVERLSLLELPLYLYLTQDTDERAAALVTGSAPDEQKPLPHTPVSVIVRRQRGADLGERLWNAFQEIHCKSKRVVFLGVDSPSLPLSYVAQAVAKLDDFPVVVGPARDGGYYLLGLAQPKPDLFRQIDWGTAKVLRQTLSKLQEGEYCLLPQWYDIDTAEDLQQLRQDLANSFDGYPSHTRQWIEDLKL